MKTIPHIIIYVLLSLSLYAQSTGEIKGKILDSLTREPLYGANVWVETGSSKIGGTTNEDGRFTIKPLPAGVYDLNVSYTGKKKYFLDNVRVSSSNITSLKEILLADNTTLGEVEIKAEKYTGTERLIKPDNVCEITLLSAEFKTNPFNKMPKEMISKTVPGVYQADDGQPLYFRGSRNDAMQYYVDGVKTRNGELGIPNCSISEINVYTGGVPAMYGDLTGGVVVIETKSFFEIYNQRHNK